MFTQIKMSRAHEGVRPSSCLLSPASGETLVFWTAIRSSRYKRRFTGGEENAELVVVLDLPSMDFYLRTGCRKPMESQPRFLPQLPEHLIDARKLCDKYPSLRWLFAILIVHVTSRLLDDVTHPPGGALIKL